LNIKEIIKNIYKKFDGEIPETVLVDVVRITIDHITEEVESDGEYSIDGFGIFSSGYLKNYKKGCRYEKRVYFKPHIIFSKLVKRKRNMFKNTKKEK
jgi:nucleoid DNA-binding protein